MNTLIERNNMQFLNVIYVLNFMINIVAESIFKNKKLHFDTQHHSFYQNDFVVIYMFRIKDHYVLENNKKFKKMIVFAIFIRTDFTHN